MIRSFAGIVTLTVALLFAAGCAASRPVLTVSVVAYADPDKPQPPPRRFVTVPIGLTDGGGLLEKNLLALLRSRLVASGYLYDPEHAELVVTVVGRTIDFSRYVPPSTLDVAVPSTQTTITSGTATTSDGVTVRGEATSYTTGTSVVPIRIPGQVVNQWWRSIAVMITPVAIVDGKYQMDGEPVWNGSAQSYGKNPDLLSVAPQLIDELMGEFPARSGKPRDRQLIPPAGMVP
ncbi:MAG: hypothetical protein HZA61_09895 [Candidatus Eisenbacteria bacterium]|uniref:DUF4136 domain-containing protein n=1 Tax=Eiseniibacteriota bacterium TaxID=2212470 RepID=A0A933SDJ9_UNCEI|nr:hypothetical protein [Candidatus Eisenbacteria bacterium]